MHSHVVQSSSRQSSAVTSRAVTSRADASAQAIVPVAQAPSAPREQGSRRATARATLRDETGGVTLEYVVLLLFVVGGCCTVVVALGVALANYFASQQAWLLIPLP